MIVQVVILKFNVQYSTINLYKVTLTKIKANRKQNFHSRNSKVFAKCGKQCLHQVVKGLMSSRMAGHVRYKSWCISLPFSIKTATLND